MFRGSKLMAKFTIVYGLILFSTFFTGCTVKNQLRSYTEYHLHDLIVEDNNIYLLIEKKIYSPNLSFSAAMMSEMPSGNAYKNISVSLLSIEKKSLLREENLQINNEKNIINNENISENIYLYFVNKNILFSSYNFVNKTNFFSFLYLKGDKDYTNLSEENNVIFLCKSFNRIYYVYSVDNKIFIYDPIMNMRKKLLISNNYLNILEYFKNVYYLYNDSKTFLEYNKHGSNKNYVEFLKVNKETNEITGRILSKFRTFWDYHDKDDLILAYKNNVGLEILNGEGSSLYVSHEKSLIDIRKALFNEDKVYAAGITTRDTPLGKKEYIEIIQWDYKNDSVIKKYYPCDSPELEM